MKVPGRYACTSLKLTICCQCESFSNGSERGNEEIVHYW